MIDEDEIKNFLRKELEKHDPVVDYLKIERPNIICECGYNAEPLKDFLRRDTCPDCGSQDFKYEE